MDNDGMFLSAVLRKGTPTALREINRDYLAPAYLPVWDFLDAFLKQERKLPRVDTVEGTFSMQLPAAPEEPSHYAALIRDNAMRSAMEDGLVAKVAPALKEFKPHEALAGAKEVIQEVTRNFQAPDAGLILRDQRENVDVRWRDYYLRKKSNDKIGLPTPWPSLTRATGGFQPGEGWILAARPNVGKSWLMLVIGVVLWQLGFRVLFVSEETPPQGALPRDKRHRVVNGRCVRCHVLGAHPSQLCEAAVTPRQRLTIRMDAIGGRVSAWRLLKGALTPQEERRLGFYYETCRAPESAGWGQFRLVAAPAVKTLGDVEAQCIEFEPDILLWDSAYQGIETKGDARKIEAAADFALDAHYMIQRMQIPGVLSWHLKREVDEEATDASLNDLALTDEIGRAFDNVLLLFRTPDLERAGEAIIRAAKTRDGLKARELRVRFMVRDDIDFSEIASGPPGRREDEEPR